ncbi:hypothetical protein TIFTF001_010945 [Ficus carica]|uniref:Uncharacterized protein n=1 Tax=Ficus carica TaxID=3494 RepID=A0AA88D2F7_FICCA|nr:hypothetical protein TIFTF001_010945 [Ficus carica]
MPTSSLLPPSPPYLSSSPSICLAESQSLSEVEGEEITTKTLDGDEITTSPELHERQATISNDDHKEGRETGKGRREREKEKGYLGKMKID